MARLVLVLLFFTVLFGGCENDEPELAKIEELSLIQYYENFVTFPTIDDKGFSILAYNNEDMELIRYNMKGERSKVASLSKYLTHSDIDITFNQDINGNYIFSFKNYNNRNTDTDFIDSLQILKLSPEGDKIWLKEYIEDYSEDLYVEQYYGAFIFGQENSITIRSAFNLENGLYQFLIDEIDNNGTVINSYTQKITEESSPIHITQQKDGLFKLIYIDSIDEVAENYYFKIEIYDENFKYLLSKKLNIFFRELNTLYIDNDGNTLVSGWVINQENQMLVSRLYKLDPNGDVLWISYHPNKIITSVAQDGADYIITGFEIKSITFGNFDIENIWDYGRMEFFWAKYGGDGEELWNEKYQGLSTTGGIGVNIDEKGNYVFLAVKKEFNQNACVFIMKTDKTGDILN